MDNDTIRHIQLAERLDSVAATALAETLNKMRGEPVQLCGQGVRSAGTLAVQVLIAAKRQWEESDILFELNPVGDGLSRSCGILGIAPTEIGAPLTMENDT